MTTIYYITGTNYEPSNTLGATRNRAVLLDPGGTYTESYNILAQAELTLAGFFPAGEPGDLVIASGPLDYLFEIVVQTGNTAIDVRLTIHSLDETGAIVGSSTPTAWQTASAGVMSFQVLQWDGDWAPGYRLAVLYDIVNTHMHDTNSVSFQLGNPDAEYVMPWVIPADPVYGFFDLDDETDVAWSGTRASKGAFDLDDETDFEWSGYAPVPEITPIPFQDQTPSRSRAVLRPNYIATPNGLTVWVVSGTELGVSWNPVAEASAYDLERDGEILLQDYELTEYLDEDLEMNQTYTYRVRSVL